MPSPMFFERKGIISAPISPKVSSNLSHSPALWFSFSLTSLTT